MRKHLTPTPQTKDPCSTVIAVPLPLVVVVGTGRTQSTVFRSHVWTTRATWLGEPDLRSGHEHIWSVTQTFMARSVHTTHPYKLRDYRSDLTRMAKVSLLGGV